MEGLFNEKTPLAVLNKLFSRVRLTLFIEGHEDEPWFVAQDVCKALEIDWHEAIGKLGQDEKIFLPQGLIYVNAPGVFRLVFQSHKDAARSFTRWVTHEVLSSHLGEF